MRPRPGPGSRCRSRGRGRRRAANAGDGPHDRAEPGDHAGPEVVAVGEAARQDDRRRRRRATPARATGRPARRRPARGRGPRRGRSCCPGRRRPRSGRVIAGARPAATERRRAAERLDRVGLDQRVRQELARRAARRSPAPPPRRRRRRSARPAGRRGRALTPSIPRWPRLPSTARPCGIEDARASGVTLTANRKSRSCAAMTSSSR